MSQNKKAIPMTGEAQAQAVRLFGRHVSREKACILFAVTMVACALPMITGVRLWESIPEIVETGIIRMDGRDDSMPRALVVFGIPGLMCLLNLIVHTQLYLNQQRMTLPKTFVRLFGRWGFTVLSTGLPIFSSTGRRTGRFPRRLPLPAGSGWRCSCSADT